MQKNKIITTALGVMIFTAALAPAYGVHAAEAAGGKTVQTYMIGQKDSPVVMVKGYATVPVRDLAASLGWQIVYKSKGVYELSKDNVILTLTQGGQQVLQGIHKTALPVPVSLMNQRLYVPVRAMTALLGGETVWTAGNGMITIIDKSSLPAAPSLTYNFANSAEGWTSGFADLPVDHAQADYRLRSGQGIIPLGGAAQTGGFMLSGMNRSDDLFMYITRKLGTEEGVKPGSEYKVRLSFDLATSYAGSSMGIGGSPAQSVYVKAGVLNQAPATVEDNSDGTLYSRMNLDKGNQSTDGKDMVLLGNIVKPSAEKEGYELKHFEQEFTVKSSTTGELYVIIGTDSGYEGLTSVYYTHIEIGLEQVK